MSSRHHYAPFIDLDNQNNDQSDDDVNDLDNSQNNLSNQNNDYSNNSDNSQNDDSDHSIDDSFNDESDHSVDDSFNTDNSIDDSFNTDDAFNTDDSYNTDDSFNTDNSDNREWEDSNNDNSQHYDTDVNVRIDSTIDNAFNDIEDSYNDNSEHYDYSSHFGEIDVNFENVFNGAFGGVGGAANGFAFNQVADIVDNDSLHDFSMSTSGNFQLQSNAGDAYFDSGAGCCWDDSNPMVGAGHNATLVADASASTSGSAFNQDIVLGANLQQNAADVTVIGGYQHTETTDTSGDHF